MNTRNVTDTIIHITFPDLNKEVSASSGTNLLRLMRREGIFIDAPCSGRGSCGKCKVSVNGEIMLACQTYLCEDADVRLPGADSSNPQISLQINDQTAGPRLLSAAGCTHANAPMSASSHTLSAADCTHANASMSAGSRPFSAADCTQAGGPFLAAFDIGTTTVAAYLIDKATGKDLVTASCLNPQAQYGADVISRISQAATFGTPALTTCIRDTVNRLLEEMTRSAGLHTSDVSAISIVGNTCMHHLFLGISPEPLGKAPYMPAVVDPVVMKASELNITAGPDADVYIPGNIAGFVGGDTVACLTASRLAEEEDWTLLVDIGTNGEIVLGRQGALTACSAAAGPAFEGALISCGMRAQPGAISHARILEQIKNLHSEAAPITCADGDARAASITGAGITSDLYWEFETVQNEKPRGICGSGLLDITAQLLKHGLIDETGNLEDGDSILLADRSQSADGSPVELTQKDIRQLQLAKGAIAAAIRLLAEDAHIRLNQISKVWLAGAFGNYLSPESACAIGLIPPELSGRIRPIGNAAGEGARQILLKEENWEYAKKISQETRYLELANLREFQDIFVEEMLFPEV